MPSNLLYDKRDLSIARCQIKANGLALPSKYALLRSARVPEGEEKYYATLVLTENYLTYQAKQQLRLVKSYGEVKAIFKPEIHLTCERLLENKLKLQIKIEDTIEEDNFTQVNLELEGIEIPISLENNQGSQIIELEQGTYQISCNDQRFRNTPVSIEVVI